MAWAQVLSWPAGIAPEVQIGGGILTSAETTVAPCPLPRRLAVRFVYGLPRVARTLGANPTDDTDCWLRCGISAGGTGGAEVACAAVVMIAAAQAVMLS